MAVKEEDLHDLAELQRARESLKYTIAKSRGHSLYLCESDHDDAVQVILPASISMEVLGAAMGIVSTRLIAKGVHISEIQDTDCMQCNGDGKERR